MSQATDAAPRPTHFRWTVFGLACGTSWLLYLHRYVFALIKPKLIEEWQLGKDELGLLDSAFSVFYTGVQLPLGILVDVAGVHLMLTGMILVWSIGLGMHAWAPSVKYLWYAQALLGIGQSAVFAALIRISRYWFPANVRTTLQGWVGVFAGRIGGLSANLLFGSVLLGMLAMPWRTAVWLLAGFGVLYALVFAVLFRNNPRQHAAVNDAEADLIEANSQPISAKKMSLGEMFSRMSPRSIANLLVVNLQTILSTLADNIYSAWIPLFLYEVHGLNFTELGIYSALPLLGGAIGGAVGGWLNDLMIRHMGSVRWARRLIGFAGKGTAGVLLVTAMWMYDDPRIFCMMLFLVKFFSDWSLTTTWGVVTDIGGRATATVFAYNNAVAGAGAIVGPALYGFIAEDFGWTPVFITGAVTYLVCGLTWLIIDPNIPIVRESAEQETSSEA